MPASAIRILLVEDNPGDVRLVQEAMREARLLNSLEIVTDGEKAVQYLRHEAPYAAAPRPDLVLLDLTLPRVDGFEILRLLQADPQLAELPLVVLGSTEFDHEYLASLGVRPDCFLLKPVSVERLLDAVRCFPALGLAIVKVTEG